MPPAAKKRKSLATSQLTIMPSQQQGIQAFAKVSKAHVHQPGKTSLKRKHVEQEEEAKNEDLTKPRRALVQVLSELQQEVDEEEVRKRVILNGKKRRASPEPAPNLAEALSTPATRAQRKKTPLRSKKITETPTKGARSLLENFIFDTSSPPRDTSPTPIKYETPPSSPPSLADVQSPAKPSDESDPLPEQIQDLVNLYSSFLTALSLYYAHNGLSNPADLRNLYPGIERTWKKRSVRQNDIQRILGIANQHGSKQSPTSRTLHLFDYGHNKICVEVSDHALHSQRRVIDEPTLNAHFAQTILPKWSFYKSRSGAFPDAFIATLPLHPITPNPSLKHLKPLLSKGQLRLSDLKAGAIAAQARNAHLITLQTSSSSSSSSTTNPLSPSAPPQSRAASLLDRLHAKSLHQSTLTPPSPVTLARKRALQRLPEIAPVLQSLALGSQRHDNDDSGEGTDSAVKKRQATTTSFTMATLVQHLQMSLRNPISGEEAVRCVRCLAEVAPEWVGIREVGRLVGVIVGGVGVGRGEIEGRVKGLLEAM